MSGNPFLALEGAVEDRGVPSHFGAPIAEQRLLDEGKAIVSLSNRGIVTVSGEDRLAWLHSMTSQGLVRLQPGESVETLLLDPQGRIEHAIRLVDDGVRSWLIVDEGSAESLAAYLQRMRFAMRVEVADVSDDYTLIVAFDGANALAEVRALGVATAEWQDPWSAVAPGGVQYAHGNHQGATWSAVYYVVPVVDMDSVANLVREGKVRVAGSLALEALEVRAWRPTQHGEVDERSIPHELDWLRTAVHLNKGCYRGQETIAKVHNLGHPPRRLALLHLDGSGGQLPTPGALIRVAGEGDEARPVGRVTRAALHYEWGGIALALLKRSVAEEANLEVWVGDAAQPDSSGSWVTATQEVIVPSDAGKTRDVPRLKRL